MSLAQAQTDSAYEVPGIARGRAHQALLPWESIDTLSGGIKLRFVDFEMPGDAGVNLAIERTYDSKWSGAADRRWRFGIAGVPMEAQRSNTPQGDSVVVLTMSDGTRHPAPAYPSGQSVTYRTRDLLTFRWSDYRLDMPNGLHAYYQFKGSPSRLVLTEIHNVHGIVARLSYYESVASPLKLWFIDQFVADPLGNTTANGFGTRDLEFVYGTEADPLPSRIQSSFGREIAFTWNGSWQLESATTAANQRWAFTYAPAGTGWVDTVTTPNGAVVDYDVRNVQRSWVTDNPDYPGQPVYTYAVTRRAVTDPRGSASGVWTYRYDQPSSSLVTIDGPNGISQVFGYGYSVTPPEPFAPDVTVREIQTWLNGVLQQRERFLRGTVPGDITQEEVLLEHTIERDGRTYQTKYSDYDVYWGVAVKPARQEIENDGDANARNRRTTRTLSYAFAVQPFSGRFMGPLVTGVAVVNTGRDQGAASSSFTYDPNTGFQTSETVNGTTVTYQPDPGGRGNVWRRIDANNNTTTFTYAWGVVKDTATPRYTISRDIRPSGLVGQERRPGGSGSYTTNFDYDADGRPTYVAPPAGDATTTEYASNVVTIRRGAGQVTKYFLNGLGDAIAREDDVAPPHVVRRERTVDAWGRSTFQGLPRYPADGGSPQGADAAFDSLHRIRWERDASIVRTRTYQNGDVVIREYARSAVQDPDTIAPGVQPLRVTTQRFDAWGDPDNATLRSVTDAEGGLFSYTYNVLGALASVTEPGGVMRTFAFVPGRPDLIDSETHPESGTTSYLYDPAGRRIRRTAGDGRYVTYGYDGNNRLTSADINGTDYSYYNATFDYDSNDRRLFANNGRVRSTYQHDGAGRLWQRTDVVLNANQVPIGSATVRWEYDGRDNPTKIVYSSGTVVEYGYDRANRLNVVKRDGVQILGATQLHASGAMQNALIGLDLGEVRTFDALHRVERIQAGKVSTLQAHLDIGYQYSDLGNVTTITDGRGASESGVLGYDGLDRLKTITGFNRPQSTIIYDALGNRTALGGTYTYNQSTQRLTSRPGESFGYDSHGNVTSDGAGQYTYSPLDTMVRHTARSGAVTTYDYDADNVRRHKSQGNDGTMYMTDDHGRVLTEWARVGSTVAWQRDYIYAGSRLLAAVTPAPLTSITVGFTATAQTRWENDGPAPFALVLATSNQQPTPYPVTVRYQTVNGSAIAGNDFTGTNLTYTFPAGTPNNTWSPPLSVNVVNDIDQVESQETFSIALSAVTPGVTISSGTHAVTINDDDAIAINFTAPSSTVGEAVGTAPVAIVVSTPRGAATQRAVTVSYSTVGGTATQGLDYVGVSGSFVIGAGTPSGSPFGAGIPIVNDAMWENGETFTLSVSAPAATVGPPHAVTIVNDDTAPYYAQVDLTTSGQAVWEYAGAVWISAVVTTYNGAPTTAPIPLVAQTVHEWGGANPATPNVDYQALGQAGSGALAFTIPAGTASGAVFSVALAIGNDPTDEPNEWFQFRMTPTGATSVVPLQGIWIYDDDPGPFGLRATAASADTASLSSTGDAIAPPTDKVKPATSADLGRFRAERRRTDSTTTMTWTAGTPRP